ncbi:MAG: fumarylacetoacetate hydrolase family protein [Bauldia sp.]
MRLASYRHKESDSFGIVTPTGLVDIPWRLDIPSLRAALTREGALAAIAKLAGDDGDIPLEDVALLPPVTRPDKIICIGVNYRDHAAELGSKLTEHPVVFVRWPSSLVGNATPLVRPRVSERFDYEGELAVIIGKAGRHIAKADALAHVAGYSCLNDGSIRDFQRHTGQFTPGKNFVASGAFGPWMVTADEVADPQKLSVRTTLNGAVVQDGTTADMIFPIADIIAYVSTFTELVPGDVIATGTPSGVGDGRTPPLYMKGGDVVEVAIEGIGTLRNPVIDEA